MSGSKYEADLSRRIGIILDTVNRLIVSREYDVIDDLLRNVDTKHTEGDILLAYLTSTFPAKKRLVYRKTFFAKCENALMRRPGEWEVGLLLGLD